MDFAATNRGDYFADDDYIRTDVAAGVACDRAGTRVIGLSDDLFTALQQTLAEECGPVLKAAGYEWGDGWAKRLAEELGQFHGQALSDVAVARFEANLCSAFRCLGWGILSLDFGKYDKGLIIARVRDGLTGEAADALLAGALAGLFSHFTGQNLDAVATDPQGDSRRFVLTLRERLNGITEGPELRLSHEDVVAKLEATGV
jgi:hypothetical protein